MPPLAAVLLGCSAESPTEARPLLGEGLTLPVGASGSVTVSPATPVARGPVALDVDCTDAPGAVPIAFSALMPEHGHATEPAMITPGVGRVYRIEVTLPMTGRWEAQLDLQVPEGVVPLAFDLQVP